MKENSTGFEVRAEQRQSWFSIAAVWAGGMICVPCLMIGGVLTVGGLSIPEIIASILIGYGMICAYMIFIGMQAWIFAAKITGLKVLDRFNKGRGYQMFIIINLS